MKTCFFNVLLAFLFTLGTSSAEIDEEEIEVTSSEIATLQGVYTFLSAEKEGEGFKIKLKSSGGSTIVGFRTDKLTTELKGVELKDVESFAVMFEKRRRALDNKEFFDIEILGTIMLEGKPVPVYEKFIFTDKEGEFFIVKKKKKHLRPRGESILSRMS